MIESQLGEMRRIREMATVCQEMTEASQEETKANQEKM
jgi:hypothetical protein